MKSRKQEKRDDRLETRYDAGGGDLEGGKRMKKNPVQRQGYSLIVEGWRGSQKPHPQKRTKQRGQRTARKKGGRFSM